MVSFHSLSLFAIPLFIGVAADSRSGDCLPRLRTHPAEFKLCETKLCLMFLFEAPYKLATDPMKKRDNQTLFNCKEREKIFSGLNGVTFQIMDKMKQMDDVYCVYAGNNCTFDGLIDLASTPPSPTWRYRLGVSGMMYVLPHRIRPFLKPLVAMQQSRMALIGRRQYHVDKPDAVASLFSPFALIAWISIVGCFALLAFLWMMTVWQSSKKLRLSTLARAIIGEPRYAKISFNGTLAEKELFNTRQEYMHLSNKMAVTTIRFSTKAFIAIIVILYEVTIVNYLFEQRSAPVTLNMKELSKHKLGKFTFTHGGATESMFRKSGNGNFSLSCSAPPCIELTQVLRTFLFCFVSGPTGTICQRLPSVECLLALDGLLPPAPKQNQRSRAFVRR